MAFLLYTHVLFLITLYTTSGRNAAATKYDAVPGGIELAPTPQRSWYSRVRTEEPPAEAHIIGNDEDED